MQSIKVKKQDSNVFGQSMGTVQGQEFQGMIHSSNASPIKRNNTLLKKGSLSSTKLPPIFPSNSQVFLQGVSLMPKKT